MRRILLIAILLVVPLLLTGCSLKRPANSDSKATPTPKASTVSSSGSPMPVIEGDTYLTIDPAAVSQAIATNKQAAANKVEAWHDDAVLSHVSVTLPSNLAAGQATEVYTYGSASDAYNWWTMTISGKTGKSVRAIIPKEDYLGTAIPTIPTQHWKIDYVEAFQLAEVAGGADFRAKYPSSQITLSLGVSEPKQYLWWTVEYLPEGGEPFRILVNPSTKEVFNESGIPITAATPSPAATED